MYCVQVFCQQLESTGCKLVNAKTFPPSLRLIAPADKISINLNCTDADWNLLEDSDFQRKVKRKLSYLSIDFPKFNTF
jgi:hypothetical protein